MGDVFDALNRAKQERDAKSSGKSGKGATGARKVSSDKDEAKKASGPRKFDYDAEVDATVVESRETPALPLGDVDAISVQQEDAGAMGKGSGGGPASKSQARAGAPADAERRADESHESAAHDADAADPASTSKPKKKRFSLLRRRGIVSAATEKARAEAEAEAQAKRDEQAKADVESDARNKTSLPVPHMPGEGSLNGYSREVIVHHDRGSIITEQYRAIRTQILARARNRRLQTHVVTSSAPEEGKSVTSINLALAFSELRNQKTLLIEGDLRRPSFGKLLDRECDKGLIQLLRDEIEIDDALQETVYDNLQFIPAGGREANHSTELLSSPGLVRVLDRLKDRYDHIFIDTPPVLTATDSCILGALADDTMLVVRLNRTPIDVIDRAKRLLRAANCDLAGVILTHLQESLSDHKYRYSYYYGNRAK